MKVLCTTENLKKGILTAEKIIGKNLTLPILSNILVEAEKGGLRISATNLEIGLVSKIRAKVEKEGKIAIPGRIAGGILSQMEDGNKIVLEEKNGILKILYNGNSASIKGMDAKDFPIIPKPQSKHLFEIDASDMQKKIPNVLVAAAVSDTRQELNGIYFEFLKDKVVVASTDSFRLVEAIFNLEKLKISDDYKKYIEKNSSVIVPARTFSEVTRAIGHTEERIMVYLDENQIFFEVGDTLFVSRLIDGKYPEYKQVIPREFVSSVLTNKDDFLKAVRLAGIFSDSKSREIKIRIEKNARKMTVFAESVESGEGSWGVDCQSSTKENVEISFNNRFLLDAISSINTEKVNIGFNDSFGPVMFREVVDEKPREEYFHIVMPIRN